MPRNSDEEIDVMEEGDYEVDEDSDEEELIDLISELFDN